MPRRLHRRLSVLSLSVVATVALSACSSATPDGAGDEDADALVIYNAQHEKLTEEWADAFTEETGIAVVLRNGGDSELGNQLVAEGEKIEDVVLNGALRRLRPVLLTASITAFGLVPLLFATGPGSEVQRPLAIVVIGGLVSSTLLTLLILPLLYRRFGVSSKARFA